MIFLLNFIYSITLSSSKFSTNVDYLKLESGFPSLEDLSIPTRTSALLEAAFKEITPFTMAMATALLYDETRSRRASFPNSTARRASSSTNYRGRTSGTDAGGCLRVCSDRSA